MRKVVGANTVRRARFSPRCNIQDFKIDGQCESARIWFLICSQRARTRIVAYFNSLVFPHRAAVRVSSSLSSSNAFYSRPRTVSLLGTFHLCMNIRGPPKRGKVRVRVRERERARAGKWALSISSRSPELLLVWQFGGALIQKHN